VTGSKPGEVTGLLLAWREGDEGALQRLVPLVYQELRRLAHSYMSRERETHTLQTTALVHEVYSRLVETPRVQWRDRSHFYAICAQLMRRILVDYARSRCYLKRGGGVAMVSLQDVPPIGVSGGELLLAVHEALTALSVIDGRKGQVVEMRFFGGLTVEETSVALNVSPDTVMRDWKVAKAWLRRQLGPVKRL
jgi:RNA polymerase sigma factor (TIGR02999 family)